MPKIVEILIDFTATNRNETAAAAATLKLELIKLFLITRKSFNEISATQLISG